MKLNIGIIGFGYMGKMHAMCYENIKFYYNTDLEVNLYAVVTSKTQEELPVKFKKIYSTYEELLMDENVDVIDICSPNYMHAQVLIKAIEKNKHIYCEKPLSINLESAKMVMEAYKKYNYSKVSRVTFEYRFVPAIIRAKEMIDEGRIGKIINFNFRYYGCEFLDPQRPISWQSDKEMSGGGVLYAMGTHSLDLIRYLVGDVKSVFAQKKTHFKKRKLKENPSVVKDVNIEDIINIQMNCDNEVMGTLILSQVAAGSGIDFTFEIYGENGCIKFNHENPNVIYYFDNKDEKEPHGGFGGFKSIETTQKYGKAAVFPPPRVNISWSRYHIASLYQFLNGVSTETKVHPDIVDGYAVQLLTDAIYKSAETGNIEQVEQI